MSFLKGVRDFIIVVVAAVIIAFVLKHYIIVSCKVLSGSMEDTLIKDDRVLALRIAYSFTDPARGDIIIFQPPAECESEYDYIKRIIGMPGETIEVKSGTVYVDGVALVEDYIKEKPLYEFGPVTVPENSYLVFGDNRNNSLDSHLWSYSFISYDDIDGKVFCRYYPLDRLKIFKYNEHFDKDNTLNDDTVKDKTDEGGTVKDR